MAENNDPNKPRRQRQVPQPEEEYEWAGGIPGSQVPQTSNPLRSRPINVNDGYAGGIPGLSEIPSKSTSTTLQSRPSNVDDAHAGGSPSRQPEQQVKVSLFIGRVLFALSPQSHRQPIRQRERQASFTDSEWIGEEPQADFFIAFSSVTTLYNGRRSIELSSNCTRVAGSPRRSCRPLSARKLRRIRPPHSLAWRSRSSHDRLHPQASIGFQRLRKQ